MRIIISRTCTEISAGNEDQHQEKESRPLEAFRDVPAYVLLGDPGAGKTTAFEAECEALGERAYLITARDFQTFDPQSHPEWRDKTLFIDGLDETRVGANDARTPFDQIRGRLDALGKPRFRLSCREADWLGANDQKHLESVSPNSKVTVLRLNPLTDSDIADILNTRPDIGGAQEFIALAQERRVYELLKNPQTLKMLADVVAQGGGWPKSRKETFEMACGQMVREPNEEHQAAQESNSPPAPDQLLNAAGRLCAVQLISGVAGYTLRGQRDGDYPAPDQCDYDCREVLRSALVTKLFKGPSNNRIPVHRHIAEFLGARHLAEVIKSVLPAQRVIALITGEDGTVVTEMRGLSAWLAALCEDARADLIERDPIGVGLYGDIREFSTDEKRALLESLDREASRLGSVLLKTAPFGGLASPDMESVLREILEDSKRDKDHQTFTRFVLEILGEGSTLPGLSDVLLKMVRDDTWWPDINVSALLAFIDTYPEGQDKTSKLEALLADVDAGNVSDPNNQFLKNLLAQQLEPAVSADTCQSGNEGLSIEVQQEHARDEDRVKAILEQMRPSWATPFEPLAKEQEEWYRQLLAARPKIVAEVQVPFVTSELHRRREVIYKLKELAHDPDHASLARYASLPLLKSFPTRCNLSQIEHLDYLLWAATQHADRASLQELIKSKLSRKSMNDAQRVHWLAAGVIIAPRAYNDRLRDFVQGREGRIRHLVTFFENRGQVSFDESRIALLEFLISLLGSYIGPRQRLRGEGDETTMQGFSLVHQLIHNLAASPTKDASDALDRLLAEPTLSRWHDVLSQAQDAQRVTWRDASYRRPTIEQVCQTLNGGTPANAADLAALVMDRLDEIARKIRGGSTSDWRQYWHVDQYNRPTCEKPEDACRDNLLSDLQNRLEQLDIDAQPEGRYTNDKRSDIRVYFGGSNVPVEIKKNSHQKLWSSLRNQLIAQYTIDPDTDGYGIYLVFWFGKDRTPPPPSGTRPTNAEELKKRLEATLSPNEARKISICVIDVSRPD